MRSKHIWQSLLTLITLLGVGRAGESPATGCTAQAWVRAPDLVPDSLIQGDVRIKISTGCPAVETVMLGLRLKERSVIKALRSQEDRIKLESTGIGSGNADWYRVTPWEFPRATAPNATCQEMFTNRDLWIVREEQRLVFESTQTIRMEEGLSGYHDVVHDFAVLVPSTNFPPALNHLHYPVMIDNFREVVHVGLVYEYFVRVPFANGTTEDISAGITSFHPLALHDHTTTPEPPTFQTAHLHMMRMGGPASREDSDPRAVANYTTQVSGLVFTQGSEDQVVTIAITRTGPARTFTAPLSIQGCVETNLSSKWAVQYGIDSLRSIHSNGLRILHAVPKDVEKADRWRWGPFCYVTPSSMVSITMPNSTLDEIRSGAIVTTTSEIVTVPIRVDGRHIIDFETYYQTFVNSLRITLTTPRAKAESINPDKPSSSVEVPTWGPKFTDDEEPWVPWENHGARSQMPPPGPWSTYVGNVPAIVHPMGEAISSGRCQHTLPNDDALGQVVLIDDIDCGGHPLNHYLDEGARAPIFVDRGAIHELLAEDPMARNLRAPILAPVVTSIPEGEELVYRYNPRSGESVIYVGETWMRKVVNRGGLVASRGGDIKQE